MSDEQGEFVGSRIPLRGANAVGSAGNSAEMQRYLKHARTWRILRAIGRALTWAFLVAIGSTQLYLLWRITLALEGVVR